MKSNSNLYLNASKTVVLVEGDADSAFLFIAAGRTYTKAEIEAVNPLAEDLYEQAQSLIDAQPEAEQLPAETEEPEATEPETKEVDGPDENKGRTRRG